MSGQPQSANDLGIGDDVASDDAIAYWAQRAGWTGHDAAVAVAVALAESGGRAGAMHTNANGSHDYGMWQINYESHKDLMDKPGMEIAWADPLVNAQTAHTVWQQSGGSFKPWSSFNSGKYSMFLNRGLAADSHSNSKQADDYRNKIGDDMLNHTRRQFPLEQVAEPVLAPLNAIVELVKKIFDPKTWISIGIILVGAVMLMLVGWKMLKDSSVGKTVGKGVGIAKKVVI